MPSVKMTISVPEELFKRLEQHRKSMKMSRSQTFATAAHAYLSQQERDNLKDRLNAVYSDPAVQAEQTAFAKAAGRALIAATSGNV